MHQHQSLGPALAPGLRQVQVVLEVAVALLVRFGAQAALAQPEPCHLGSHEGPVNAVPGPAAQAFAIATGLDPVVQELAAELQLAMHRQVHPQKGQLTDRINPAQGWAEFQGIEYLDAAGTQQHVSQVEIPMAFADVSALAALPKPGREPLALLLHPVAQTT